MRRRLRSLLTAATLVVLAVAPVAHATPTINATITAATAGDNGWYVSDVSVTIQVTGGPPLDTTCPAAKTFHTSSDTLDCVATDGTPVGATLHLQFKIDKDKPTVTGASPDRQPNGNGWYNAAVNVTFAGSDPTSGIASCQQLSYSGPDSATAGVSGTCRDVAGNVSAPVSFALKYDATAPSVSAAASRDPDGNGWYTHPVSVSFTGSDATSGVDSCTSASYSGPDTGGTALTGSCTDKAGNSAGGSLSIQYDATAPSVSAALDRPPDANGWYNHPVTLNATGTDAGSGIDGCTGGSYDGAPTDTGSLTGTCKDKAGNSASASVAFKYDASPPKLVGLSATGGNGKITLHWTRSADTSVTIVRMPSKKGGRDRTVYHGTGATFTDTKLTNGLRYRYSVSAVDQAGNQVKGSAAATPLALTRLPAKLKAPPTLRWAKVPGASYYNVQLFHAGKKILSTWPVTTSFKLSRAWKFAGKKHKLVPGAYRWYVWPGYGPRKASKYGKLLGGSRFVVR